MQNFWITKQRRQIWQSFLFRSLSFVSVFNFQHSLHWSSYIEIKTTWGLCGNFPPPHIGCIEVEVNGIRYKLLHETQLQSFFNLSMKLEHEILAVWNIEKGVPSWICKMGKIKTYLEKRGAYCVAKQYIWEFFLEKILNSVFKLVLCVSLIWHWTKSDIGIMQFLIP